MKDQAIAILEDWTDVVVQDMGPFWLVAGNDPRGVRRSGCNADVIDLAERMAAQGRYVAPEPEPVSAAPASTETTADAAPEEASAPVEDDGGSSFLDMLYEVDDTGAHPSGIGVMVNNTGGVMASDRTEELRSQRMGEVVRAYSVRVDARWTMEKAQRLNALRSQSQAAKTNAAPALTEEEDAELDAISIDERWASAMSIEQQTRLDMLGEADGDTLQAYVAREGWPT